MNLITLFLNGESSQNIDYSKFLETCYKVFYERIKAYFLSKTKNLQQSEDLTQETFIRFLKALEDGQKMNFEEEEDILKYLLTISKNLFLNSLKKKDNQSFEMIENLDSDSKRFAIGSHDKFEQRERLSFLSKQIPPKQWEMFKLQSEGFSIEEIAKEFSMKEDTIKKAMQRSRKRNNALFKQLKL